MPLLTYWSPPQPLGRNDRLEMSHWYAAVPSLRFKENEKNWFTVATCTFVNSLLQILSAISTPRSYALGGFTGQRIICQGTVIENFYSTQHTLAYFLPL